MKTIDLSCEFCKNSFVKLKKEYDRQIRKNKSYHFFCSHKCSVLFDNDGRSLDVKCKQCEKSVHRAISWIKKRKYMFCSRRCAGVYWSKHKIIGTCRSKMERWIEEQLTQKYPNLLIDYNKTNTINAELDIYIPSLKLAFEFNGIFHYEPIFGYEKLKSYQTNDNRKIQACLENKIELCIIDTHTSTYFKKERDKKFLDIVIKIIDSKIKILANGS